jgi:hypothetical protein
VLVILSCRLSRPGTQPPGHPGSQLSPARTADPAEGGPVVIAEKATNIADLRGCGLDR